MRFFFDNNIAPRIARAINALVEPDHSAVHLRDKFDQATSDITWMESLGADGDWVVISADQRIARNGHERKAWQESGLTLFFWEKAWHGQNFWLQAAQLVRWFPDIIDQARKVEAGAGFFVPFRYSGRFKQPRLT